MSTERARARDGAPPPRDVLPIPFEDRLPPQNLEAERGALGSMLLDADCIPDVLATLEERDFYRESHRTAFRHVKALWGRGEPADAITVLEEMRLAGDYERFGGDEALAAIMDAVPHAANAVYYARIVRQKAIARALIEAANEIQKRSYANQHTAEELTALAERAVFGVADARVSPGVAPMVEGVDAYLERMTRRQAGEVDCLSTGYPELDDLLDGLQAGNLYVLAARPSLGKTALALNICEFLASEVGGGRPSLVISLEMDRVQVGERILACRSGIPIPRMRRPGGMGAADFAAVSAARDSIARVPVLVDDTPGLNIGQVDAVLRRAILRDRVEALVIDYLQLIDVADLGEENRVQQVAALSKRLKQMARRLKVPVLALAQLNRNAETRQDRRPRLADLRESGSIEQDADAVMLLHRPDYYDQADQPGVAEVIVAKNRGGATGMARLLWQPHLMRFVPHAPGAYAPAEEPFG
jgi:replicative DNA helicase